MNKIRQASFVHPILSEIQGLNLPQPDQVVVNHGSAMVLHGIRSENIDGDIDLATSLENVKYLRKYLGWITVRSQVSPGNEMLATRDSDNNYRFDTHRWMFSPMRYKKTGKGRIGLDELIKRSIQDVETGIWVATTNLISETKEGSGRPKDVEAITLIKEHIKKQRGKLLS